MNQTQIFTASRWTRGNRIFPTRVEVSPLQITCVHRGMVHRDEESIALNHIASVRLHSGLLFAELLIESSGGTDPIVCHGLWKRDATRIKELLEQSQRAFPTK